MIANIGTRYSSLELIPWWDTHTLRKAKALVIGAGALGNEVLKNLALLGLGHILIVDFDIIESSNLSRAVLFRESDVGRAKAEVAALRVKELNPDVCVQYAEGNIRIRLGAGVFRRMDLIFGCVDNLEARVAINAQCYAVEKVWFDAAIEVLTGEVRTFIPDGKSACFECGLEEDDYLVMNLRYSCAQLLRESLTRGKQPTTPIISSIISAMQVQEAIRYLHGFEIQPGILHYNGHTGFLHKTARSLRSDCLAHNRFTPLVECPRLNQRSSLHQVLETARESLGPEAILEFDRELLVNFSCSGCGHVKPVFRPTKQVSETDAVCPSCGRRMRPATCRKIAGDETFLEKTLEETGFPPLHLYRAYTRSDDVYLEASGDAQALFAEGEWRGLGQ